ncbi:MAG: hypothetical protein ISS34_07835, partial [Candidatus Omnitrophica bacterium]|nr:hypothetical protein [Candidatus Omnitrophota bacterium]
WFALCHIDSPVERAEFLALVERLQRGTALQEIFSESTEHTAADATDTSGAAPSEAASRVAEEVVANKLLARHFVDYYSAFRRVANPDFKDLTVVSGCSGSSVAEVYLATGFKKAYFVDELEVDGAKLERHKNEWVDVRSDVEEYWDDIVRYFRCKYQSGCASTTHFNWHIEFFIIQELKMMGVRQEDIDIGTEKGRVKLSFSLPQEREKKREIIFIKKGIRDAANDKELMKEVDCNVDIYFQKASESILAGKNLYFEAVSAWVKPEGFIMLNNYYALGSTVYATCEIPDILRDYKVWDECEIGVRELTDSIRTATTTGYGWELLLLQSLLPAVTDPSGAAPGEESSAAKRAESSAPQVSPREGDVIFTAAKGNARIVKRMEGRVVICDLIGADGTVTVDDKLDIDKLSRACREKRTFILRRGTKGEFKFNITRKDITKSLIVPSGLVRGCGEHGLNIVNIVQEAADTIIDTRGIEMFNRIKSPSMIRLDEPHFDEIASKHIEDLKDFLTFSIMVLIMKSIRRQEGGEPQPAEAEGEPRISAPKKKNEPRSATETTDGTIPTDASGAAPGEGETEDTRAEKTSGSTGELLLKPEEVVFYYKRKGESIDRRKRNSIWTHLPPELSNFSVLTPAREQTEGLVILTNNALLIERLNNKAIQPSETYEVLIKEKVRPADLKTMQAGLLAKVGRRRKTHDYVVRKIQPEKIEVLETSGEKTRLRVGFSQRSEKEIAALFDKLDYAVEGITKVAVDGLTLSGVNPGGYRRVGWDEILVISQVYLEEPVPLAVAAGKEYRSLPDEIEDCRVIEFLLNDENVIRDALHNIFLRLDIRPEDIQGEDIYYYKQGRFKRVYRVTVRTAHTNERFSFFVKVVMPDVVKSDSDYNYDAPYAAKITEIVRKARQHDLYLYPPVGGHYSVKGKDGGQRIVFVEGIIPATSAVLSPRQRAQLTIITYLMYYHIMKVFFDDPKPENAVIQRKPQRGFKGTVVDNDNLRYDRLDPYYVVNSLVLHGYVAEDIVDATVQVFGSQEAHEFLASATFPPEARYTIKKVIDEFQKRKEVLRVSSQPPMAVRQPIRIVVNGRDVFVPEGTTLLEVLEDCYVDLQTTIVTLNGKSRWWSEKSHLSFKSRKLQYQKQILPADAEVAFYPRVKGVEAAPQEKTPRISGIPGKKLKVRLIKTQSLDAMTKDLLNRIINFTQSLNPPIVSKDADVGRVRSFNHAIGSLISDMRTYLMGRQDLPFQDLDPEMLLRRSARIDFTRDEQRLAMQGRLRALLEEADILRDEFIRIAEMSVEEVRNALDSAPNFSTPTDASGVAPVMAPVDIVPAVELADVNWIDDTRAAIERQIGILERGFTYKAEGSYTVGVVVKAPPREEDPDGFRECMDFAKVLEQDARRLGRSLAAKRGIDIGEKAEIEVIVYVDDTTESGENQARLEEYKERLKERRRRDQNEIIFSFVLLGENRAEFRESLRRECGAYMVSLDGAEYISRWGQALLGPLFAVFIDSKIEEMRVRDRKDGENTKSTIRAIVDSASEMQRRDRRRVDEDIGNMLRGVNSMKELDKVFNGAEIILYLPAMKPQTPSLKKLQRTEREAARAS